MTPYAKSTGALRRMRQRIFDYSGPQEVQADRVLLYLKRRSLRDRQPEAQVGPYSGLTQAELYRAHTCETDWY